MQTFNATNIVFRPDAVKVEPLEFHSAFFTVELCNVHDIVRARMLMDVGQEFFGAGHPRLIAMPESDTNLFVPRRYVDRDVNLLLPAWSGASLRFCLLGYSL